MTKKTVFNELKKRFGKEEGPWLISENEHVDSIENYHVGGDGTYFQIFISPRQLVINTAWDCGDFDIAEIKCIATSSTRICVVRKDGTFKVVKYR